MGPERDGRRADEDERGLPRRAFLKGTAAAVGAVAVGGACQQDQAHEQLGPTSFDAPQRSPQPPVSPAPIGILAFFTRAEYQAVDAMTERIYPTGDDGPGARAAGVANYIDKLLAAYEGFPEPTYDDGPYMETYSGTLPPPARPGVVYVPEDEADRYGFQSGLSPQQIYRAGLESLEAYCESEHGQRFMLLDEDTQDEVLVALEDGEADGFDEPTSETLFALVRAHTLQGMFGDPLYGGNRNKLGWAAIGYPGAWRAYNPRDMRTEGYRVDEPVSLLEAPHFHAGDPVNDKVVLPVRGSERSMRRVPRDER